MLKDEDMYWKLDGSVYGSKLAPMLWHKMFREILAKRRFTSLNSQPINCVFQSAEKLVDKERCMLMIY